MPVLHKPVAKRLLVAVVQVKVASVAAPATAVHLVHAPAFCCLLYQKKSTVKREKQDLEDNILIYVCVWLDYVNVDQKNIHEQSSSR